MWFSVIFGPGPACITGLTSTMVRPGPPEYLSDRVWAEGPARRVSPARPEVCPCRARHASIGPGQVRARAGRHVWTCICTTNHRCIVHPPPNTAGSPSYARDSTWERLMYGGHRSIASTSPAQHAECWCWSRVSGTNVCVHARWSVPHHYRSARDKSDPEVSKQRACPNAWQCVLYRKIAWLPCPQEPVLGDDH
jgi:hypothetical protein